MSSPHESPSRSTLLIVSQVYVPDPASVGQHIHDVAAEMAQRGYRVIVYTARRGYNDSAHRYPRREQRDGVEIRRLPLSSLGKGSIMARVVGGVCFLAQATLRGLLVRELGGVLISTSPPMAPLAALVLRGVRGVPFVFWAMDINPDQMIAMGRTRATALPARLLETLVRTALRCASHVVALDRFMADRLEAKVKLGERLTIIPPWPHEHHLAPVPHEGNPFRREHGLGHRFVVMYSGNLSPAHPVDTILEAASTLRDDRRLLFLFIGAGAAKQRIEMFIKQEKLTNLRILPYQPLDQLRYSLSAADVHLVAMGDSMVGIVHPCKLYGAMTVARPILLLGPKHCPAAQIIEAHGIGWQVDHGDVDGAVAILRQMAQHNPETLTAMGERARVTIGSSFSKHDLCGAFCTRLETAIAAYR